MEEWDRNVVACLTSSSPLCTHHPDAWCEDNWRRSARWFLKLATSICHIPTFPTPFQQWWQQNRPRINGGGTITDGIINNKIKVPLLNGVSWIMVWMRNSHNCMHYAAPFFTGNKFLAEVACLPGATVRKSKQPPPGGNLFPVQLLVSMEPCLWLRNVTFISRPIRCAPIYQYSSMRQSPWSSRTTWLKLPPACARCPSPSSETREWPLFRLYGRLISP